MPRNRANPRPEKPDVETQAVFDRLQEKGFEPQLISFGGIKRIIIRKGSRDERSRRLRLNRSDLEGRDSK